MGDGWVILRTAGRTTIGLAESLAKDGFEVWTPAETKTVRVGRVRRRVEIRQAIMPTYVFARERHLVDLLELAKGSQHARFHVLHAFNRIPMVADVHLTALRRIEAKRTPVKRALYAFPRNARTRVHGGLFSGHVGVVVRSTPARTMIQITGGYVTEIPTSLLELDGIQPAPQAARKAA
jgi:hypothetical protein